MLRKRKKRNVKKIFNKECRKFMINEIKSTEYILRK